MEGLSNYDIFIRKYNLSMKALLNADFKKAHRLLVASMEAYHNYAYEVEGVSRIKALRFGKELSALEKALSDKLDAINYVKDKVQENALLSNIAGLDFVKDELKRLVIYPQIYPDIYAKYKRAKGGGILMYGVPGTGKTWIAKEVAKEIEAHFIEVKCSTIMSKWFGESERNIKEIFDEARQHACTIIFFDEFEALGATRGKEPNSPIGRIVSELLSQIQGFNEFDNTVIVMAATNRPWDVDSAFLRPGRFNNLIHIPLPDEVSRKEIILSEFYEVSLSPMIDLDDVVRRMEGFNRADVVEFCDRLKDEVINRIIYFNGNDTITLEDVEKVFKIVKTSVRQSDLDQIEKYIKNSK